MWSTHCEVITEGRVLRFSFDQESSPLSFGGVLRLWQHDAGFRSFFNTTLANVPFSAFRWETPPITEAATAQPFGFVVLDSPELTRTPDPHAFAEHFDRNRNRSVLAFSNLSGDAIMIVPRGEGPITAYVHLAAFVREAPEAQQHAFWSLVGKTVEQRLASWPIWLSTAGAGVAWLHVRVDNRPKYYGYAPFRQHPRC